MSKTMIPTSPLLVIIQSIRRRFLRLFLLILAVLVASPAFAQSFEDRFDAGALRSDWIAANWTAPMGGTFDPTHVDLSQEMLRLKLVQPQNPDGSIVSIGSEVQTRHTYHYGTFEFEARVSSTADGFDAPGQSVSGTVSGLFIYFKDATTEIDFEVEGQSPSKLWMTNYVGESKKTPESQELLTAEPTFRTYKFVWMPGRIEFYVDGVLVTTHTTNVPKKPAHLIINHWGTNTPNWGGVATPGVDRFLYVKRVSYTPLPTLMTAK